MLRKLQKSKFVICLLVAVMLVFSYNQSKPKAFIPLGFAAGVLASMAAETLITMGVKAVSKATLKKKADDYAAQALAQGKYDFMGTNPYRNKDGSITVSPSISDRAKMAGLIGGSLFAATQLAPGEEPSISNYNYCLTPIKENEIKFDHPEQAGFLNANLDLMLLTEGANNSTYLLDHNGKLIAGSLLVPTKYDISTLGGRLTQISNPNPTTTRYFLTIIGTEKTTGIKSYLRNMSYDTPIIPGMELSMDVSESVSVPMYSCEGLVYPETVFDVPRLDMSKSYDFSGAENFANKTLTIYNVYPPSETEGPVSWDDLENNYAGDIENQKNIIADNIGAIVEKGDININPITIEEINNDYTKLKDPVEIKPQLPEVPPGGDISPVEPINRGMLQVMKESYQFLSDGIDNSIQSMKTVTDKSMGLINYLDSAFRWLPPEWRAMFGAAFVLGVFAHFFRR